MNGLSYALLVPVALFIGTMLTSNTTVSNRNIAQNEAQAISGNMAVYRPYVAAYAAANPSVAGSVPDSSLGLPAWYSRIAGISNHVAGGKGYVYYSATSSHLPYLVTKQMSGSINAGLKSNGNLINPLSTTNYISPVALPAVIPDGSAVMAP